MNKNLILNQKSFVIACILILFSFGQAFAMDNMDGVEIHKSVIGNYTFTYKLIDMRAKFKDIKATHHLMVMISMKHGDKTMMVTKAKVGYSIQNPEGEKANSMAMAMSGAYGSNVNFDKKGEYTIKAKMINNETKLIDTFKYSVK